MITKRIKRFLSAFLCTALLVSQFYCDHVMASDNAVVLTYEEINQKIVDAYERGEDPAEIMAGLTEEEAQILSSYYSSWQPVSLLPEEILEDDEVGYIDMLAAEYYNALEDAGQLEVLDNISLEEADKLFDSLEVPQPYAAEYYVPSDYCAIIKNLGYTFTFNQIARQLVLIGNSINLGAAFPFIELTAIVAGAFIVTFSVAVLYCAAMVATNELVCGWYLYNTTEVNDSTKETARVVVEYQSGERFWMAHRADWKGMGGIAISVPITIDSAVTIVIGDEPMGLNVFCVNLNDAKMLVQRTGELHSIKYSQSSSPVQVHRNDGKILNMQHIHAMIRDTGEQGKTHIFFAIPFIM